MRPWREVRLPHSSHYRPDIESAPGSPRDEYSAPDPVLCRGFQVGRGPLSGERKMKTFGFLLFASTAVIAQPSWFPRPTRANPPGRRWHAMAFDSLRARLVMIGGESYCSEGWERDASDWTTIQGIPNGIQYSAAVFDASRDRTVLFGGLNCPTAHQSATWEWDGTAWTQRFPSVAPPPRYRHAMAFDRARNRTILFGGAGSLADTWDWDGTVWVQRSPANSPPGRESHAMAFDSVRNRVVLFGGVGLVPLFNDTWEYDGTNWTQRFVGGFPAGRRGHAMAFDSSRGRTMLFGGTTSTGLSNETWEWDGTAWAQIGTTISPPACEGHGIAYDSALERMVLFHGCGGGAATWELWSPPSYCRFLGLGHTGGFSLELACVDRPAVGTTFNLSFVNSPTWAAGFNLLYLGLPTSALPFNSSAVCSPALLYAIPLFVFQVLGNPAVFPIGVPNEPALVGQTFGFQGGSFEISGCFRLTDGLAITVQP